MDGSSTAVRFGVVGIGAMGASHARWLRDGAVPRARLAAVADRDPARCAEFAEVPRFADAGALIRSGAVDAIVIATPHFDHVAVGIDALERGLHVLVEKPIAPHVADCRRLMDAYARRPDQRQRFGVMFNTRTVGRYQLVKRLIDDGELGAIQRIAWMVTDWFRSDAYYASAGWRGTWRGEGGGLLVNQAPHHLDLLQWLFGMPVSVRADCGFGRWHPIEVEDEVAAHLVFPGGATGAFVASTGEAPGSNRLEIAAERGRLVVDGESVGWLRNAVPSGEFRRTSRDYWARPATEAVALEVPAGGGEHVRITANFVDAILDGAALIAPAEEGVRSVELANAMILSALTDRTVRLPIDAGDYERRLHELIARADRDAAARRAAVAS
ncbi:MAG TPA: Gfo/Idh/MocA family oxidoreductase [Planctomycetota bacterium]|nr:Gfo/Idh/MocA family oxidoreductase [Planctomycetota bacterium]